jgi:hypothetical protein
MKSILILLFLSPIVNASETWVPASVRAPQSKVRNLKGVFLTETEKPASVAECMSELKAENQTYPMVCTEQFGKFLEEGAVKISLLGSHIHCTLKCVAPPIPAGKCIVQKYVDSNGAERNPFYILQTADLKYTFERIIVPPERSAEGVIVELLRVAHEQLVCEY